MSYRYLRTLHAPPEPEKGARKVRSATGLVRDSFRLDALKAAARFGSKGAKERAGLLEAQMKESENLLNASHRDEKMRREDLRDGTEPIYVSQDEAMQLARSGDIYEIFALLKRGKIQEAGHDDSYRTLPHQMPADIQDALCRRFSALKAKTKLATAAAIAPIAVGSILLTVLDNYDGRDFFLGMAFGALIYAKPLIRMFQEKTLKAAELESSVRSRDRSATRALDGLAKGEAQDARAIGFIRSQLERPAMAPLMKFLKKDYTQEEMERSRLRHRIVLPLAVAAGVACAVMGIAGSSVYWFIGFHASLMVFMAGFMSHTHLKYKFESIFSDPEEAPSLPMPNPRTRVFCPEEEPERQEQASARGAEPTDGQLQDEQAAEEDEAPIERKSMKS